MPNYIVSIIAVIINIIVIIIVDDVILLTPKVFSDVDSR